LRDENTCMPVMNMRLGSAQGLITASRPNPSLNSVAPASAQVGHLVKLAMACLRPRGLAASKAKRALEYIEDNLGSKMKVREVADFVALSASHFSRAFKQSLGCSPMAYVAARRVERAKLMVTSTRERLMDIALTCGFSDQAHLTRSFRRVVGMSPGRWRRTSNGGPPRIDGKTRCPGPARVIRS
jgi:transcriptional regulator GlxA family with amidase domain